MPRGRCASAADLLGDRLLLCRHCSEKHNGLPRLAHSSIACSRTRVLVCQIREGAHGTARIHGNGQRLCSSPNGHQESNPCGLTQIRTAADCSQHSWPSARLAQFMGTPGANPPLTVRLREQSRALHAQSERLVRAKLVAALADERVFAAALAKFYFVYSELEVRLCTYNFIAAMRHLRALSLAAHLGGARHSSAHGEAGSSAASRTAQAGAGVGSCSLSRPRVAIAHCVHARCQRVHGVRVCTTALAQARLLTCAPLVTLPAGCVHWNGRTCAC